MTTRTITGTLYSTTGDPLVGAPVVISADRGTYTVDPDITYVPGAHKAVTNASGVFSVAVEEGLPVLWNVALPGGERFQISIPTGDDTTLEALREAFSGGPPAIVRGSVPYLPVFNVKSPEYGAVGDGVTADKTAIVAAIDACSAAGGGIVFFPPGTYMAQGLILPAKVWLMGSGREVTILKQVAATNNTMIAFTADVSDQAVTDMTIDGNLAAQTGGAFHGVRFHGSLRGRLERLIIKNCASYGIGVGYSTDGVQTQLTDAIVRNIELTNIGSGDAIDAKRTKRCLFDHIYAHDLGGAGHALDIRGQDTVVTNCHVKNVTGVGIALRMTVTDTDPGAGVTTQEQIFLNASNCFVENASTHGFWIEALNGDWGGDIHADWRGRAMVDNCVARDCGSRGFFLGGDRAYIHLTNCLAEENTSYGFYSAPSDAAPTHLNRVKLTNCTALNNDNVGFFVNNASARNASLVNCEAIGNGSYGFSLSGSGHSLVNCRALNNSLRQVDVVGDDISLIGGSVELASGTGVRLAGDRARVSGVTFTQASSGTALSVIAGGDNALVESCSFAGVTGGTKVSNSGTGTRFRDNLDYVTRNAGVTSVADGGTISHGLVTTPTKYGATTTTADEYLAITAVSSTTLTVALTKHDGTAGTTANVAWWAEV